jgi:hypothetical protein
LSLLLSDYGIAPSPIKTEKNKVLEGVEIFLQSTTPQAFQFYRSCGFKQINLPNEDNRELLPPSIKERQEGDGALLWWVSVLGDDEQFPPSIKERQEGDGALLWWVSVLGDDEQFPRLLYLPPGQNALLSPVNNQYNAVRKEAHSFTHQFQKETETTLATLIKNKLKAKEEEIMTSWTRHTDNVSKKILSVNPCLIQKKMIMFPQNLSNAHWMVTFVFNPSSMDKDTEYRPGLRKCFFRFCSMNTTG